MGPQRPIKIFFGPKWAPPLSIGPTSSILAHFGPSWTLGTSSFVFGPKNVFYGILGARMDPQKYFFSKMDPTIIFSVKNCYTGPIYPTLSIWEQHRSGSDLKSLENVFLGHFWGQKHLVQKNKTLIMA